MSAAKPPETRDRLLAHVAFEAVWERDLQTGALKWDGNLESIFGYNREEVVNHISWWREHVHPDDLKRAEQIAAMAIRNNAPGWSNEYRFRRKDGSWAWVASRCAIERDADGHAHHTVGAMIDITQLKDTESRLRLFTEQFPARACVTDRDLRVVWDAGAAFAHSPSVVGKTVPELFAQSPDRERVLEGCRRALAGQSTKLEIDDGTSAAELQLVPFRDPGGNVIGTVGIAFDITDRVRSEAQVRAGQRLLQKVLEILPVGVFVMNRAGDVLLHNPASTSVWGKTIVPGQERWVRSEGFWHGSGRKIGAREWASVRALEEGQISRDELIDINTFDGHRRTIENYAAPIRDEDGVITGAIVVNQDVTERVRAEEALRKTQSLLLEAERLGQTGSWEQDLSDGGEVLNTEANRHLFFGDDGSKGARLEDYIEAIHPDDRERVMSSRQELHDGTGSGDIEYRVVWPDGSVHWIFGRATIVRDENGRPLRAYGTNADITERKLAEEELERRAQQLQALSSRLLQSQDEERRRIARELHDTTAQNLGALRINLAALKRSGAATDPPAREALEDSIALAELAIAEIRTLSYVLHPPMIEEVGLAASLRWYAHGFQERSGVTVNVDLPADLERLPIEVETAVFRIVQEALTNIWRHSGSDVAMIRMERQPRLLRVDIRDKGRGMPQELRGDANLFAASGVGIASMRERARELGGSLEVKSDDRGTAIEVQLPIDES